MLTLKIDTDNAAFEENDQAHECARILSVIANKLRNGVTGGACVDVNGNAVGTWSLTNDGASHSRQKG